jgi:hypothetical protein
MMFSDPFGRADEPGDPPARRQARLVCRLVVVAVAGAFMIGNRVAPLQCEPFLLLGGVVMLLAMVLSYVF